MFRADRRANASFARRLEELHSRIDASNRQHVNSNCKSGKLKMRKVLIAALGLASLGTLAGVQPAFAAPANYCANVSVQKCVTNGRYHCTTNQQVTFYNQCWAEIAAHKQQAARQQIQNAINAAQTPTGILGSGRPPRQAK
jgi:hypothetical protein